tara:strand:+ start:895 stop:1149 length:255 start_codon:yes stop_codon:yes gene_type:complete
LSEQTHIATLKIASIIENDDGTSTLSFNLDDEFIEWFKKDQGLKRFSHKRFSKFINEAIKNSNLSPEDKESSGVVGRVYSAENK